MFHAYNKLVTLLRTKYLKMKMLFNLKENCGSLLKVRLTNHIVENRLNKDKDIIHFNIYYCLPLVSWPSQTHQEQISLTHNKTKEHIDGRIHMCELYLSSVCCFGLLNHASATRFFYLYTCARCFGLLNNSSSTRFFYL